MNLGELKQAFIRLDDEDFVFMEGFYNPHAYRGCYEQVAFEPREQITLSDIKKDINKSLNDVFEGYKGGEYEYGDDTLVNLSDYGISGKHDIQNFEELVTKMLNEYSDSHQTIPTKKKRKTAAEKRQEQQAAQDAENAADWELFKKEYPVKFAALIFDFLRFNTTDYSIDIVRIENSYEFCWGTEWNRNRVDLLPVPPENYDWLYLQSFRDAEQAIENEREKLRDAERKELLKQTALAKLSKEERKVLGL